MTRHSMRSRASRALKGTLLSALLLGAGAAFAAPSQNLDNAMAVANSWLAQADANQADAMWKSASPSMQNHVPQSNWVKYIGDLHKLLGQEQERSWLGVDKIVNPKGMPAGEYLNVFYVAKYTGGEMIETVSLAPTANSWQPVGYVVHRAHPATSEPAASQSAAPAQPSKK
jgi:hypothetical protein